MQPNNKYGHSFLAEKSYFLKKSQRSITPPEPRAKDEDRLNEDIVEIASAERLFSSVIVSSAICP